MQKKLHCEEESNRKEIADSEECVALINVLPDINLLPRRFQLMEG